MNIARLFILGTFLLMICGGRGWGTDSRPNLIIIMVDDMGFSDIGCYGGEVPTPHLDNLAANGLRFRQFYNTGRCCPTRASLLTGQYSHRAGVGWMTQDQGAAGYRGHLNQETLTIAEVVNGAGYFTIFTGKWHVGFEHGVTPWGRGFQRSLNLPAGGLHFGHQTGEKGKTKLFRNGEQIAKDDPRLNPPWYGTRLWTEQGIGFMDEAISEGKPFFWYLAHTAPHFPCMAPEETIAQYRGRYRKGWDQLREERYQRQIAAGLIDSKWALAPRPDEIPAWDDLEESEQIRYDDMMAIYAAMIHEIDVSIGILVAALKERGLLDNTLILFLSDNGGNAESGIAGRYEGEHPGDPHSNVFIGKCWAHLNNTPFRKYKHFNHEGGVATPLIAHWPRGIRRKGGAWEDTPAHVIDLMATCVDLSGATYPCSYEGNTIVPMAGQSLAPLLEGKPLAKRNLYWEHEGNAAVREGDWKLVRSGRRGAWELYDLAQDRSELNDLSSEHPDRVQGMVKDWRRWALENQVLPYPKSSEN